MLEQAATLTDENMFGLKDTTGVSLMVQVTDAEIKLIPENHAYENPDINTRLTYLEATELGFYEPLCDTAADRGSSKHKKMYSPPRLVPVVYIYGRIQNPEFGFASIRLDVFGFYPKVYVLTSREPDEEVVSAVVFFVRDYLARMDSTRGRRRPELWNSVVQTRVVPAHTATPYSPEVSNFIELTLALPEYVKPVVESMLEAAMINDFRVRPFSNIDALAQFQTTNHIHAFDVVSVSTERIDIVPPTAFTLYESIVGISCLKTLPIDCIGRMRALCFDIECKKSKGIPVPENDEIILICAVCSMVEHGVEMPSTTRNVVLQRNTANPLIKNGPNDVHFCFSSERDLLDAFSDLLLTFDPDFIIGHNHVGFDIPFVTTRANIVGSRANFMGKRDAYKWQPSRKVVRVRKSGETRESFSTETPGRIQVDTMLYIQKESSKESSYRLTSLAMKYLGRGKDDVGYNMIEPLHNTSDKTRSRLAHYCLMDSVLTWGLCTHDRFNMIISIIETSRATMTMASRFFNGVQDKIWMLVYNRALNPEWEGGAGVPALFPYCKPVHRNKDDKYQGATVLNPTRGYYRNKWIMVGDYSSLYPSIMIAYNYDYGTTIKHDKYDGVAHNTSPIGVKFVSQEVRVGILPSILKDLLSRRGVAKKKMAAASAEKNENQARLFNGRQLSLKITANSIYGFLGADMSKLPDVGIAASVTAKGREMIALAKGTAENAEFGCRVVYGDTDSIMFLPPEAMGDISRERAFELLKAVCSAVSRQLPPPMELQPEKCYRNQILIAKKRYVANMFMSGNSSDSKLDYKGVELARRDGCNFARELMQKVITLLVVDGDVEGVMAVIHNAASMLLSGTVPITDLVITKSISKPKYKSPQIHVTVAENMAKRDPSYPHDLGERIPYVIIQNGGKKLYERGEDPLWTIQHDIPIDMKYYLMVQVAPPITRLMCWAIGKRELLDDVARLELQYDKEESDDNEKRLRKAIDRLTADTEATLFGQRFLGDIPRIIQMPKPARGSISMFFTVRGTCPVCRKLMDVGASSKICKDCIQNGAAAAYRTKKTQELAVSRDIEDSIRKHCAECRGYDTEKIQCVQRDCIKLYQRAIEAKKIDKLLSEQRQGFF